MGSEADREYLERVRRILAGEAVTLGEFQAHVDHQNTGAAAGLPVGAQMPDFALADQAGKICSLPSLLGPAGLLMVFVRTVNWCGYCRNQLAEMNQSVALLRRQGVSVAGFAPDSHELVAEFARFAELDFPLLADTGARLAEQIGILNPNIPSESVAQNCGRVPFPGHYLLNQSGAIVAAEFTDDLRHRISATTLTFEQFGRAGVGPVVTLAADELTLHLEFATLRVQAGQEIAYRAVLEIARGWHLYGPRAGTPFQPLDLSFEHPLVGAHRVAFPPARPLAQAGGLGEVPVYAGRIEGRGRIRLAWSPPVHGSRHVAGLADILRGKQTPPGEHKLTGSLAYQACGADVCMPPVRRTIEVPITIGEDVGNVAPVFSAEI